MFPNHRKAKWVWVNGRMVRVYPSGKPANIKYAPVKSWFVRKANMAYAM